MILASAVATRAKKDVGAGECHHNLISIPEVVSERDWLWFQVGQPHLHRHASLELGRVLLSSTSKRH